MPLSTRCAECNTPIKGHARRDTAKATLVTQKIKENGKKKRTKKPENNS